MELHHYTKFMCTRNEVKIKYSQNNTKLILLFLFSYNNKFTTNLNWHYILPLYSIDAQFKGWENFCAVM